MNHKPAAFSLISALTLALAPTLAATSANATQTIALGTTVVAPSSASFLINGQNADLTLLTASFTDTIYGSNTYFDDVFTFTSPLAGIASAFVSVSPAGPQSQITIAGFVFNGQSVSPSDAALGQDSFAVSAGEHNTIEITGETGSSTIFGSFSGMVSFEASAVPEPATWATFLLGFGFLGWAVRRTARNPFAPA